MVTTVGGDLHNVSGTVEYDGKELAAARLTVSTDARTLDTKLAQWWTNNGGSRNRQCVVGGE
jgi:polyisoprenoid-binding protein YceI